MPDQLTEKGQEYQKVMGFAVQEVAENDPDYDDALEVMVADNDPEEKVAEQAKRLIVDQKWWLQYRYFEKGNPKEQYEIALQNNAVSIYNFGEPLTPEQQDEFRQTISLLSQIQSGKLIEKTKYIVIDNLRWKNPNTGEELNGFSNTETSDYIMLTPAGTQLSPHRIKETSNLKGTLIHELCHTLGRDNVLVSAWRKKFGWQFCPPRDLPGGHRSIEINSQPEKCITDYAQISAKEDISESMVAALAAPETLDPERLAFIKDNILGGENPTAETSITKKQVPELPKLKTPVKYKKIALEVTNLEQP